MNYLFLLGCSLCVISQAEAGVKPHTPYLRAIADLSPSLSWPWPTLTAKKQLTLSFFPHYPDLEAVKSPSKCHVAVLGDSFAAPFASVATSLSAKHNISVALSSVSTCAPFFDPASLDITTSFDNDGARSRPCKEEVRPAMLSVLRTLKPKVALLVGNWAGTYQLWASTRDLHSSRALQKTLEIIRESGVKVVVIGQIPGAYFDVPRCFDQDDRVEGAKCARWSPFSDVESPPHTEESRDLQTRRNTIRKTINAVMYEQVARFPGEIAFVDPYQAFCDDTHCKTWENDLKALYYDDHHLSLNGTMLLKPAIEQSLIKLGVLDTKAVGED